MKTHFKIIPLLLSLIIFLTSIYHFSFISYADWKDDFKNGVYSIETKFELAITYVCTQIKCVVSSTDFLQYIKNKNKLAELEGFPSVEAIYGNYITEKDDNIIISEDFVAFIKQALKEYADETCGFVILSTANDNNINPSKFGSYYQYQSFRAFTKEYGLVGLRLNTTGSIYIVDLAAYIDGDVGFYKSRETTDFYQVDGLDFKTWAAATNTNDYVVIDDTAEVVVHSWDEAKELSSSNSDIAYRNGSNAGYFWLPKPGNVYSYTGGTDVYFLSDDGRNILMFKSKEALQNYSVDHRTIFFGSGFYQETGPVTGSYDELQDWLDGKYDDFFDRLKDTIGGANLSEDQLEKLVDQLLGKLGDIDDSLGDLDNTAKETNSWLEKIYYALIDLDETVASAFSGLEFSFDTSGIEEYLAYILEDLDYITYKLDDMTEEEVEDKTDSLFASLTSAFSDIVDVASRKFPLSLPWDIYHILTFLGGERASPEYEVISVSYSSVDGIVLYSDEDHGGGGGYDHYNTGDDSGGGGHYREPSSAPVFEIPFVISESQDLSGTLNIDLSDFDVLSSVSHTLFTLIFCYNLIGLTFKVVSFGKDLIE